MPDSQGRPTLAELIAEIEDDIERADLNPQVALAVNRAIRHFQPQRFFFNERILTFETIPGADVYGRGDVLDLPDLFAIDGVVLVENGQSYRLKRVPETRIELYDDPASAAQPTLFSYFDRSLRLWPMPSGAWTVRVMAHVRLPAPELDEANAWTDEAGSLIAAYAKRHLALNSLRDAALAKAQQIVVDEEAGRLLGQSNVLASSGQVAAYDL
ncbi:phage adaptor protein [Methylobacterium organophilum]|uniref:Phage protein n=1 Tax=Methylobacterium organophilum TaxID=410 RepID=A0ABQ4TDP3_METOR|nr:hypothetical protein [Methylobacterium organophilum]GJE29805.1 hypothetical protein LKMONMHP_4691 [Methylobacterium organophilum]